MAERISTPQQEVAPAYRPIALSALTGFVLSSLFTCMVVVTTLVALVQGLPVFLPGWALAVAVAAALVSLLAQYRIRNAEGTLAGLALARWGVWLSVLLGVTYFVYTWVTGLALAKQATAFLMVKSDPDSGFFPLLKNAAKNHTDLYQAFLLSLPTTMRGGSNPADEAAMLSQYDQSGKNGEPGNVTNFSKHPLVLALSRNSDKVTIEPLGVVDWNYDGNSYHVIRNFRFTTPESTIEATIPVQSTEGTREGEQRKWFVNVTRIPRPNTKPTPFGEKMLALRFYSKGFLEKWRTELSDGKSAAEYKESATDWTKILPKSEAQRTHVKKMVTEVFHGERRGALMLQTDDSFADCSALDDGRIQVVHPAKLPLAAVDQFPNFTVDLEFKVATTSPIDLAASLPLPISWEVRQIRVTRAAPRK